MSSSPMPASDNCLPIILWRENMHIYKRCRWWFQLLVPFPRLWDPLSEKCKACTACTARQVNQVSLLYCTIEHTHRVFM